MWRAYASPIPNHNRRERGLRIPALPEGIRSNPTTLRQHQKNPMKQNITAVPIPLAGGATGWIHAGATRDIPPGYELIRCAQEIPVDEDRVAYDVSAPDFQPLNRDVFTVIHSILDDLRVGRRLYVGCMGGTGRTGTLLSLLVATHPAFTADRAIGYIRQVYRPHAVEKDTQAEQIRQWHDINSEFDALGVPAPALGSECLPLSFWDRVKYLLGV